MAKRILYAQIEQVIEFDCEADRLAFIDDLNASHQRFEVVDIGISTENDKVRLHIIRQYNKNKLLKEGE
jgi:hypothetical protein